VLDCQTNLRNQCGLESEFHDQFGQTSVCFSLALLPDWRADEHQLLSPYLIAIKSSRRKPLFFGYFQGKGKFGLKTAGKLKAGLRQ